MILKSARLVSDSVRDRVQVLDRVVRHPQPDFVVLFAAAMSRFLDLFRQQRDVFRVDPAGNPIAGHWRIPLKLKDAIEPPLKT